MHSDIINDSSLAVKVSSTRILLQNYIVMQSTDALAAFSNEHLTTILPEVTLIQQSIFQHNEELMGSINEINSDILKELQEHLKLSIDLLQVIDDFISNISTNGQLDVQSHCYIPININKLIYATFYHCKTSEQTYKHYYNTLQPLPELFQATQSIQLKLMAMIESQFVFQLNIDAHRDMLLELFDGLCETGSILFGLNSKLMASTWKCYANLIKLYATRLTHYDVLKPLRILFGEISLAITRATNNKSSDVQTFKICNFLLRIASTIIFTFPKESTRSENSAAILDLITNLYNVTGKNQPDSPNAELCDMHVHSQIDTILAHFLIDPSVLIIEDLRERDDCAGFMSIVKDVMPRAKIFHTRGAVCNILKVFFDYLNTQKEKQTEDFNKEENYQLHLVNFTTTILGVSREEYKDIEEVLLINTCREISLQSMFACDLWVLILSFTPPTLCFNTLMALADKYKARSSREFRHHQQRIFLRRCFASLPDALQAKWIAAYTAETHLNLWALFGVGEAAPPRREYLAQVIVRNVCRRCDRLEQINADDLQYAMDGLEVLSGLCVPKDSPLPAEIQHKFNALVVQLFRTDAALLESRIYIDYMMNSLLPCIVSLIVNLRVGSAHLLQILNVDEAKENALTPIAKLIISVILAAIAKTSPNEYNAFVFAAIARHLNINTLQASFSTSSNSQDAEYQIVNLYANDARVAFERSPEWMKNLANVQKPPPTSSELEEPRNKKIKLQKRNLQVRPVGAKYMPPLRITQPERPEDEVQDILDNMKDEVRRLQKLAANGKWTQFSKDNSLDIQHVLSKLQQLMYRS